MALQGLVTSPYWGQDVRVVPSLPQMSEMIKASSRVLTPVSWLHYVEELQEWVTTIENIENDHLSAHDRNQLWAMKIQFLAAISKQKKDEAFQKAWEVAQSVQNEPNADDLWEYMTEWANEVRRKKAVAEQQAEMKRTKELEHYA